jgi:alkaline phosphatase
MASRTGGFFTHLLIFVVVLAAALAVFSLFGGAEVAIGNLVLRAQNGASHALAPPPVSAFEAARFEPAADVALGDLPENVIVILGDGMGIGTVSAASHLLSPPGVPLAMERAPVVGLMHTWAADILATDSAAAATAMATGSKTDKGVIGLLPDGRSLVTLFEAAHNQGLATAVVTTSGLADATPGGFLAHVASRDDYDQVLAQVLGSGTDILIGGDWSGKPKALREPAYRAVLEGADSQAVVSGITVVHDMKGLQAATPPLIALFPPRPEMPLQHGPPLSETTARALDLLERGDRPFVILVESEVTDEAGHSNDMDAILDGMRELDDTVAMVLERFAARNDTLILVVSDHETGGPHLLEGEYAGGRVVVRWAHEYHSSQLVPVFAFGPGSTAFSGVFDNTEFGVRIARLLALRDFPRLADSQRN